MGRSYHALGIALVAGFVVLFTFSYMYFSEEVKTLRTQHEQSRSSQTVASGSPLQGIAKRNEISRQLNRLKQDYGKLSCKMLELQAKHVGNVGTSVSQFGGWCKQASMSNGSHAFDKRLAEELSHFFSSKRVGSFGDGPGDYKRYIDKTGRVQVYDSYDGAPFSEENSNGAVKFLDLTSPQYGLPSYDWIMSLEVAEHIPTKFESVYVDNIVRHAREGIVLSWAVPGQGGLSHVNNRPLSYVKKILREKGFEHDDKPSVTLRNKATFGWLRNNINVYRRMQLFPLKDDEL